MDCLSKIDRLVVRAWGGSADRGRLALQAGRGDPDMRFGSFSVGKSAQWYSSVGVGGLLSCSDHAKALPLPRLGESERTALWKKNQKHLQPITQRGVLPLPTD